MCEVVKISFLHDDLQLRGADDMISLTALANFLREREARRAYLLSDLSRKGNPLLVSCEQSINHSISAFIDASKVINNNWRLQRFDVMEMLGIEVANKLVSEIVEY